MARDPEVVVSKRYRVLPGKPMPSLDSPRAEAYAVTAERDTGNRLYALVCRRDLAPRHAAIEALSRVQRPIPLVRPVAEDVVDWPAAGGTRPVIVLEQPGGERLIQEPGRPIRPWRENHVVDHLVRPVATALLEFSHRATAHRAIRLDNLFFADSTERSVMLGECVSEPPALSQPAVYETVNNALVRPTARSEGDIGEDLYALGVLAMLVLAGGDLGVEAEGREITQRKINAGSYGALVPRRPLTPEIVELLRGLVCDDPEERWSLDTLSMWLSGRRMSPKQLSLPRKANRTIQFNRTSYHTTRGLALGMVERPEEALALVTDGELARWLERGFGDSATASAIRDVAYEARSGQGGATEAKRSLATAILCLDPQGPLHYDDVSVQVDGLARDFAINYRDVEFQRKVSEMVELRLPQKWLAAQNDHSAESFRLRKAYDVAYQHMLKDEPGFGPERVLYENNPGWPCLSPMFAADHVSSVEHIIPALERAAQKGRLKGDPIDKHIAAFCFANMKSLSKRVLNDMSDPTNVTTHRLGQMALLAEAEKQGKGQEAPTLAAYIAEFCRPMLETFHDRNMRMRLEAELKTAATQGRMGELLALIGNPDLREEDEHRFRKAKSHYAGLLRETAWLKAGGLTGRENVRRGAQSVASLLSFFTSGVALVAIALAYAL